MLAALAARRPIDAKVALIVAHPDDETLAAGGSLRLMPKLLLIHVTDGAPRTLTDVTRNGFQTPAAYARARADELALALALASADPVRETLGIPDQETIDHLDDITDRLHDLIDTHHVDLLLTHAYEGGHPDHDSVARCVHCLGRPTYEFAGYHAGGNGRMITQEFLPDPAAKSTSIRLPPSDLSRKRAMLDCFRTQADMLANFDPTTEKFRAAPRYNFSEPPHAGQLLYERWGWMDGQTWRDRAGRLQCAG